MSVKFESVDLVYTNESPSLRRKQETQSTLEPPITKIGRKNQTIKL